MRDIKLTKKQQEQFDILADALDTREKPFKLVMNYEKDFGFVPAQYQIDVKFMANYEEFKRVGSWRGQNGIVERIVKAAIRSAENKK